MKNKIFIFNFVEDILFFSPLLGNISKKSQPPPLNIKFSVPYEDQFVTTDMVNFLQQHVNQQTRVKGQRDSWLDLVFTRDENIISDIEYLEPLGKSDHSVLLVIVNKRVDVGDVWPNTK